MVDRARVERLLETLAGYRDQLAPLRDLPASEYKGERALAARYLVQASAQVSIDIANHLIASSGWRAPADYRDSFTVLQEQGIIDVALAERMRNLAGLRNRLVHVYEEIDDAIVQESLTDGLHDLSAYAQAIAFHLAQDDS
jgi:uncharacterized protein YutE (UPF0331/DUF86 family)